MILSNRIFRLLAIINLLALMAMVSPGCTSATRISGVYIETKYGDTLFVNKDKTYNYVECLSNNKEGLTDGTWKMRHQAIKFKVNDKPLVGYTKHILPDTIGKGKIAVVDKLTNNPIAIDKMQMFSNGKVLRRKSFKVSGNTTWIKNDFDSIVIKTRYLKPIILSQHLSHDTGYTIRIRPMERLYILDKVPFLYVEGRLEIDQTSHLPATLSFSKL